MLGQRLRAALPAVVVATAGFLLATTIPAAAAMTGTLEMGPQGMEGNLVVASGTTLYAGYDFTVPGSHPQTTVTFVNPHVVFDGQCSLGGGPVSFTVPMPTVSYSAAANDSAWYPSGDQQSALTYEGQVVVPDLCSGGDISLASGATFFTLVDANAQVPGDGLHVRWHYSANGSAGSWSGTAHLQPASGGGGGTAD
jgi:hypothetical protein